MIGVLSQDTARFSVFTSSITSIQAPAGTSIEFMFGMDIPASLNQLVDTMLLTPENAWIWIMGDDHVIPAETLTRLLEHGKDIVVPLCLMRMPPYKPVIYDSFDEENGVRQCVDLDDYPNGGLIRVHSAGNGGMVIRREVFERMPAPWFEYGKVSPTTLAEDVYFCDKARELGYDIWCDLDAPLGHCTTGVVWPQLLEDGWTHGFVLAGGFQVSIPREIKPAPRIFVPS
jgi:hypothetical protein